MNIYKEVEIKHPLFVVKLDNGIELSVYENYTLGSDGKQYYHVGKEDAEGELQTVGWSCDIGSEIIIK